MEVLKLLSHKNSCLEKFLDISQRFLEGVPHQLWEGLDAFEKNRDAILRTLEIIDRRVNESITKGGEELKQQGFIDAARKIFAQGEALIQRIGETDQRIMQALKTEADQLAKMACQDQKNKLLLAKFKSQWVKEPGKELDHQL